MQQKIAQQKYKNTTKIQNITLKILRSKQQKQQNNKHNKKIKNNQKQNHTE